ncbi:MAG: phage tail protein [Blastocatellia bacterium]
MPRRDFDPYANFNYKLEIDGITNAGFSECSGLNIENTPIEYREGNDDITPHKQPGLMKYGNITLKRGITKNPELVTWLKTVMDGDIERRSVSILLENEQHQDPVRWNLREAWACKWTGPDLKANASEIAIESLEICHEGVERQ